MAKFRCIHCGSRRPPQSFIDPENPANKQMITGMVAISLISCCLLAPFVMILYPFMAWRMHRCSVCGIKVGA